VMNNNIWIFKMKIAKKIAKKIVRMI